MHKDYQNKGADLLEDFQLDVARIVCGLVRAQVTMQYLRNWVGVFKVL